MKNLVLHFKICKIKFITGLRSYHVYRRSWKPFLKLQLAFKQAEGNKRPVCSHLANNIASNPIRFYCRTYSNRTEPIYSVCTADRADRRGEVKSIQYKSSPLIKGGLEIPTEVTVKWEDRKAMDILHKKVDEVSYPFGDNDRYIEESKDILKSILNDDVSTDFDGEVDDVK